MQRPTGYKVRRRQRFVGYEEWESALFEMKSNKKALFEMKSDEKALSDEELKALFEMKMVAKNTPKHQDGIYSLDVAHQPLLASMPKA